MFCGTVQSHYNVPYRIWQDSLLYPKSVISRVSACPELNYRMPFAHVTSQQTRTCGIDYHIVHALCPTVLSIYGLQLVYTATVFFIFHRMQLHWISQAHHIPCRWSLRVRYCPTKLQLKVALPTKLFVHCMRNSIICESTISNAFSACS